MADEDKAGVYTVERFAAIGGWATVWGNSPEEAAAAMWAKDRPGRAARTGG